VPFEIEELTPDQQLNEFTMISLRTMEGLDLDIVAQKWGAAQAEKIQKQSWRFVQQGLAVKHASRVQLTDKGMLRADGIAAELFV
jgi:oxygen-independent coproporphyrinogen-3 oxidase